MLYSGFFDIFRRSKLTPTELKESFNLFNTLQGICQSCYSYTCLFTVLHFALDKNGNGTKVFFKSKVRLYRIAFFIFLGRLCCCSCCSCCCCRLLFIEALICSRHSIPPAAPYHLPLLLSIAPLSWQNYLAGSQNALNACIDWRQVATHGSHSQGNNTKILMFLNEEQKHFQIIMRASE